MSGFCSECGAELNPGEQNCSKCNAPVAPANNPINTTPVVNNVPPVVPVPIPMPMPAPKKKSKKWVVFLIIVLVLAVVILPLIGLLIFGGGIVALFTTRAGMKNNADIGYYEEFEIYEDVETVTYVDEIGNLVEGY